MVTPEDLRRSIATKLKGFVERRIMERGADSADVESIVDEIYSSDTWRKFQKSYLLNLGSQDAPDSFPYYGDADDERSTTGSALSFDSLTSDSSYNRDSVVLSPEQIQEVCNLISSATPSSKLHAVDILNNVSNFENLTNSELWPVLESRLRTLLLHPSKVVKQETFHLYWSMISSGGLVFQSAYKSLLTAVKDVACGLVRTVRSGSQDKLEVVRALNRYHRNIPTQWLRYPRSTIQFIVQEMVSLMDDTLYDNFSRIWKAMAAVDVYAEWVKIWLIEGESRVILMQSLNEHKNILLYSLQLINNFRKYPDLCNTSVYGYIYACSILMHVLQYRHGRALFNSPDSGQRVGRGWFEVVIQIIQFVKVLAQLSQQEYLEGVVQCLEGMLAKISEAIERDVSGTRREILVTHLIDLPKNSRGASRIGYVLSSSLKALTSTTSGACIVESSRYRGMRLSQAIIALTLKVLENPRKGSLSSCSVGSMLIVCGNLARHPAFFLTEGCGSMVHLLCRTLESESLEDEPIRTGLNELVKSMLTTSLGSAVLNVGTVAAAYENRLLERASIYEKMDHYSAHKVGEDLSRMLFAEAQNFLWGLDSGYVEGRHEVDVARDALICLLSSQRRCKVLLKPSAENRIQSLCNAILMLPQSHVVSEDDMILSLGVLKGLVCCLKTCIFLETRYSVKKNLQELLFDYQTEDRGIILTEVTEIAQQILERIEHTGNLHQQNTSRLGVSALVETFPKVVMVSEVTSKPPVYNTEVISMKPQQISVRCPSSCKHILEDFLEANVTLPAKDFASFLNFDDNGEQQAMKNTGGKIENTVKYGIEMTLQCGRQLGLLDEEDARYFDTLDILVQNSSSIYGASCCKGSYDFLLATVFLLLRGDKCRTLELHTFLCDRDCYFFYFHEMYGLSDTMLCAALGQVFEIMLFDTLPRVYYALQMSHYQPRWILNHWTGQLFWNILDFDEISTVLVTSMVFGGDYLLYVCISILKHIENDVLEHFNNDCLVTSLRACVVQQFKVSSYLRFMHSLRKQYHDAILKCFWSYAH